MNLFSALTRNYRPVNPDLLMERNNPMMDASRNTIGPYKDFCVVKTAVWKKLKCHQRSL